MSDVEIGLGVEAWLAQVGPTPALSIRAGGHTHACGDDLLALARHGVAVAALAAPGATVTGVDLARGRVSLADGGRAIDIELVPCEDPSVLNAGDASFEYRRGRVRTITDPELLGRVDELVRAIVARAPLLPIGSPDAVEAAGRAPRAGSPPPIDVGREPTELWAYRAGVKPVAFLTVQPDRVDDTIALFAGAHVERRDRRVHVEDQDRWVDDRTRGEPMVELYIAADAAGARRAAELQADPSRAVVELGELMGYPPCCVGAFARQADRSNNTLNRYLAAARTAAGGPWPWQLNDLRAKLVPFFVCGYRCEAAVAFATATLDTLESARPGSTDRLREQLARRVWYIDDGNQVWGYDGADPDAGFVAPFA